MLINMTADSIEALLVRILQCRFFTYGSDLFSPVPQSALEDSSRVRQVAEVLCQSQSRLLTIGRAFSSKSVWPCANH